jgi:MarR family 2-MHQ and catechol resistance regulon transcriptional repressor
LDTSGIHLWLVLWKAFESVRSHALKQIGKLDLGFSDFAVLELLLHKGPTPVNAIGQRVYLTSGSITAAVDRLEAKGLVHRCDHPGDRRARVVHLTEVGRTLIAKAFEQHKQAIEVATGGLTPEERAQAITLLKKLGLYAQAAGDNGE